jgi:hypothetical protein
MRISTVQGDIRGTFDPNRCLPGNTKALFPGLSLVVAPRFELGTSSPPVHENRFGTVRRNWVFGLNHDDDRVIGSIYSVLAYEDTDGPWLAAMATIDEPPEWLRKNDTKASFCFKPLTRSQAFGCEIVRHGILDEVSVLSPDRRPQEPLARVVSLREAEPGLNPGDQVFYGGQVLRRPGIGRVLALR